MPPFLHLDPADPTPIWRQVADRLRALVAAGRLRGGAAVPSVRDLARDLKVNPATVARAYQHLADAGLLETRRGAGTFVSVSAERLASERARALAAAADRFAIETHALGATPDEALKVVAVALRTADARSEEEPP